MRKVSIIFTADEPWEKDFRPLTKLGISYTSLALHQFAEIITTADPEMADLEKGRTVKIDLILL